MTSSSSKDRASSRAPGSSRAVLVALYVNAAVLGVIALILLNRPGVPSMLPAAMAQNQAPIAGGAGVFVMPAQLSQNTWGCYLLDVDAQTLAAYQFFPGEKMLRLSAARNFRFDRRLANFNTLPSPNEVADLVEKERNSGRVLNSVRSVPGSPEDKPAE